MKLLATLPPLGRVRKGGRLETELGHHGTVVIAVRASLYYDNFPHAEKKCFRCLQTVQTWF